jgi:hypothetical protein
MARGTGTGGLPVWGNDREIEYPVCFNALARTEADCATAEHVRGPCPLKPGNPPNSPRTARRDILPAPHSAFWREAWKREKGGQ